jgi:quinoprotein glucose dehydrogenase
VVWQHDLPSGATGAPMTFMAAGKQYIVVPVGGAGRTDGWVAFALK